MRKRLITLLSATLILAFTPYSYGDDSSNPKTPKWQVGARNVDGGSQTYGEVTELNSTVKRPSRFPRRGHRSRVHHHLRNTQT